MGSKKDGIVIGGYVGLSPFPVVSKGVLYSSTSGEVSGITKIPPMGLATTGAYMHIEGDGRLGARFEFNQIKLAGNHDKPAELQPFGRGFVNNSFAARLEYELSNSDSYKFSATGGFSLTGFNNYTEKNKSFNNSHVVFEGARTVNFDVGFKAEQYWGDIRIGRHDAEVTTTQSASYSFPLTKTNFTDLQSTTQNQERSLNFRSIDLDINAGVTVDFGNVLFNAGVRAFPMPEVATSTSSPFFGDTRFSERPKNHFGTSVTVGVGFRF